MKKTVAALVSGNIRTTLATENSTGLYVNSTVASRNWSALSIDSAKPALQEGEKELSVYAYGSEAITIQSRRRKWCDLMRTEWCKFLGRDCELRQSYLCHRHQTQGR